MWERVDIEGIENLRVPSSEGTEHGLDVSAESMHQLFLADLPHLDSVRRNHGNVVEMVSGSVESSMTAARSFETPNISFDELDEESARAGFDITLETESLTDLMVSTSINDGRRLVRVIAPERFGGLVHTLSMPPALAIDTAVLDGEILRLKFD